MNPDSTQFTNILEALRLNELEPEEQEEMLLELNELVFKGTLIRLIERMNEKTRDEFNGLMEADVPEEEIEAFIQKHVPDADSAVIETLDDLTNDILAVAS